MLFQVLQLVRDRDSFLLPRPQGQVSYLQQVLRDKKERYLSLVHTTTETLVVGPALPPSILRAANPQLLQCLGPEYCGWL